MISSSFIILATAALVSAHGQLRGVTVAGQWHDAPDIYYDGSDRNGGTPIRKGYLASSPSFLLPTDFNNDNKMACQESGPAPGVVQVKPGDEVSWQWEGATPELYNYGYPQGTWVHAMGPIITYIGSCPNNDCRSADASQIGWQKIDFQGLDGGDIDGFLRGAMDSKPEPYRSNGVWGLARMIESGSRYSSHIPQGLKNGQYILRSELAAVHNPWNGNPGTGPQNYVGCLQVEVINGGNTELPYGTKAGSLYPTDGYLAHYSVFNSPGSFDEVGPAKWDGASGSSGPSNPPASPPSNSGDNGNQNQNQGGNGNQNQNQNQGGNDNTNQNQGSTDNSNQNQNQNQGSYGNSNQDANTNTNTDTSNQDQNQNHDQPPTNSLTGESQSQSQDTTTTNANTTTDTDSQKKKCRARTPPAKRSVLNIKGRHVAKRHH